MSFPVAKQFLARADFPASNHLQGFAESNNSNFRQTSLTGNQVKNSATGLPGGDCTMQENKGKQESKLAELDVTDEQCICYPKCLSTDLTDLDEGFAGEYWKCNNCGAVLRACTIMREVGACQE